MKLEKGTGSFSVSLWLDSNEFLCLPVVVSVTCEFFFACGICGSWSLPTRNKGDSNEHHSFGLYGGVHSLFLGVPVGRQAGHCSW